MRISGHDSAGGARDTVSGAGLAQLGSLCTASLLNRSVQVNGDGSFFFAGVPSEAGLHRVRVACTPAEGSLIQGQSGLFRFILNGLVQIAGVDFGELTPIPQAIDVEVNPTVLTEPGQRAGILVTGILNDGSTVDMSDPAEGTEYWVSDERVAALHQFDLARHLRSLAVSPFSVGSLRGDSRCKSSERQLHHSSEKKLFSNSVMEPKR